MNEKHTAERLHGEAAVAPAQHSNPRFESSPSPQQHADGEVPASSAAAPDEQADIALVTDVQQWWAMQQGLWSDLKALLSAESTLAAKSLAQLLIGGLMATLLLFLCVILLEGVIALAMLSAGFSLLATTLALVLLNAIGVLVIVRTIAPLPRNLVFQHTREALRAGQKPPQ